MTTKIGQKVVSTSHQSTKTHIGSSSRKHMVHIEVLPIVEVVALSQYYYDESSQHGNLIETLFP